MKKLNTKSIEKYLAKVPGWKPSKNGKVISKEFTFRDFWEAINFVKKVARVAEGEGHHPDIHIFYNKVSLELSTHSIGGLSSKDFLLASKIDGIR